MDWMQVLAPTCLEVKLCGDLSSKQWWWRAVPFGNVEPELLSSSETDNLLFSWRSVKAGGWRECLAQLLF